MTSLNCVSTLNFPGTATAHVGKCVLLNAVAFLALFFIIPVIVLLLEGLALIPSCIQSSPPDRGQMYVAIYQSVFVKHADQTHHVVSGMCLLNSCMTSLSLLFVRP